MAKTARKPRTPRGPRRRRSHAGRIAAAALGIASATGIGFGLNSPSASLYSATASQILPNKSTTPGAIDASVRAPDICGHNWKASSDGGPPTKGGSSTYSKAARHTSEKVKNQAFANYGLTNPHDNGATYEIDHLIPLSLGGRDVIENLWPESRTGAGYNAWAKDRLEYRLYNLVCRPKDGDPQISLATAQKALRNDWPKAYDKYCGDEDECGDNTPGE